eukprot:5314532-Ditylum_brightwellii.AAC.1
MESKTTHLREEEIPTVLPGGGCHHDVEIIPMLLPPFNAMTPNQVNSQIRQVEALNNFQEVDGFVNGLHPMAFAAQAHAMDT